MPWRVLALGALVLTGACGAPPPKLVVLMAVDQLRADLLEAYDPLFTGGLRRLADEGLRYPNGTHDHAMTATAPGHHTLSTGVHPTRHGVIGNSWSERAGGGWRTVYSVEDLNRPILGYPELEGRSPANNGRDGLPDWMLANDPESRVVSISRKDRAAIGLAGKARGHVYWLAERGGEFVTSDFYRSEYPDWVVDFNRSTMPALYADTVWESVVPEEAEHLTRPDASPFELRGRPSTFPHHAGDLVDAGDPTELNRWRYTYTPYPDRAVLALAATAIRVLDLGQRGSSDYLGVSLSQTDLVGHSFGPDSREQLDNLLRLDAELGRFFSLLDEAVGEGRWVLAFSADHGVLDIPEHLAETGVDAQRLGRADRDELFGRIQGAGGDPEAIKRAVLDLPFVATAYTFDEIESGERVDTFAVLYANSHSRTRFARAESRTGAYVRLRENALSWGATTATSHGSPYYYDRHVPIVFLGGTVPAGTSSQRVATVDVAPTLARLAEIPAPDDLDGRALGGVAR